MLDQLRQVFPGARPDLGSADYLVLLREAARTESWVRFSTLLIGCVLVFGVAILVIRSYAPTSHGHFTTFGRVSLGCLLVAGLWALKISRDLYKDVRPYKLPAEVLQRYETQSARISKFGTVVQMGTEWDKYQRVYWRMEGPNPLSGRTPFIRFPLVIWLDEGDEVYIGMDPQGKNPPIFLGVKKSAPEALRGWPKPDDVTKALEAMLARIRSTPRYKGVYVPSFYDLKKKRWIH